MRFGNVQSGLYNKQQVDLWTAKEVVRILNRVLARTELREFIGYTKSDFIFAPHHELMIRKIQEHSLKSDGRLYIGMPPRHGKSEVASVRLPAWYLGRFPDKQIIHISYAADLTNDFSRQVRLIIRDDPAYKRLFPHVALDPERSKLNDWKIKKYGGGFKSVGVQGGVTGHGADLMIIDDPHKEGDAESPATLEAIKTWFTTAARTRLSPGASIIFPMTRWHMLDLAGQLLDLGRTDAGADQWEEIRLAALAEENDILGRAPGEALWADRFDEKSLHAIKALDDRHFQALFQNNPRGADDVLFIRENFREVQESTADLEYFWAFDLSATEKETSDYTVAGRFGYDAVSKKITCTHVIRRRMEFPKLLRFVRALSIVFRDEKLCFPKHLMELLAMQMLRKKISPDRIVSVEQPGDKKARANVLAVVVESGRFEIINQTADSEQFIKEHCDFPQGRFDDCVDCSSVATHHLELQHEFEMSIIREEKTLHHEERLEDLWS